MSTLLAVIWTIIIYVVMFSSSNDRRTAEKLTRDMRRKNRI
jgi:hypothetical protein